MMVVITLHHLFNIWQINILPKQAVMSEPLRLKSESDAQEPQSCILSNGQQGVGSTGCKKESDCM